MIHGGRSDGGMVAAGAASQLALNLTAAPRAANHSVPAMQATRTSLKSYESGTIRASEG